MMSETVEIELRDIVSSMVKGIVDHPEDVSVSVRILSQRAVVEVDTHRDDTGQVIGRRGAVIGSIRTWAEAWGGKRSVKVDIDYITEQPAAARRRDSEEPRRTRARTGERAAG